MAKGFKATKPPKASSPPARRCRREESRERRAVAGKNAEEASEGVLSDPYLKKLEFLLIESELVKAAFNKASAK